ncbi:hypothetical protein CDAR_578921 [Caerostris darwini]|uniref:Methyltransferase domain-containing protein n=1 Tax=Caerostris darwini TaxID=1538125 RepID=A0AAV4RW53_9ARAC|nr:hypothetical protein CDAR_578921 [Caerostris darwini]
MNLDPELYSIRSKPLDSIKAHFTKTLPQLGWGKSGAEEVVLDIGCGPGGITMQLVLPLFPQLKKIFAVDSLPNMIKFAKTNNSHPKIEYSVADIEEWSTVEKWRGQITKIVSIHCFQWLKDKKKGFCNVHQLLKTGGEAAICFVADSSVYKSILEVKKKPKWKDLFQGVDDCVSDGYIYKHDRLYYKKMVEEIGFDVRHCTEERKIETFSSDDEYRSFFASICVLTSHVPLHLKEEFKDDFFDEMLKENGRDENGLPLYGAKLIEIVVKKK